VRRRPPGGGRRRVLRRLADFGLVVVGTLAVIVVALGFFLDRIVFHPGRGHEATPASYGLAFEDVSLQAEDGVKLHGWWLAREPAAPAVLFFQGNAGTIALRLDRVAQWVPRGLAVFLLDYRGYGSSEGSPSEKGVHRDATAAYRYLVEERGIAPSRIGLFGESLGGAVAIELASRARVGAVAVESTFTSIRDMAHAVWPWVPRIFVPDAFDSLDRIRRVEAPLFVAHGTRDSIVPFEQGKRLFDAAREPKHFEEVRGADHNDVYLVGGAGYADRLADFFRRNCR
jgi:uncharacterized protein